jgi:hypothetical protein
MFYLLTPWSWVLLKKLTSLHLVNKFPAFYGIRRFITAFTSDHHLFLSWPNSIQSIPTYHASLSLLRSYQNISPGLRLCLWMFCNKDTFSRWRVVITSPIPSLRTTPCRLSASACLVCSQLPSILEAVPPSATRGGVTPCWQEPASHMGFRFYRSKLKLYSV